MGQATLKNSRRELRKALGPTLADIVREHDIRVRAHGQILRRGFFGRLKWILFGK